MQPLFPLKQYQFLLFLHDIAISDIMPLWQRKSIYSFWKPNHNVFWRDISLCSNFWSSQSFEDSSCYFFSYFIISASLQRKTKRMRKSKEWVYFSFLSGYVFVTWKSMFFELTFGSHVTWMKGIFGLFVEIAILMKK